MLIMWWRVLQLTSWPCWIRQRALSRSARTIARYARCNEGCNEASWHADHDARGSVSQGRWPAGFPLYQSPRRYYLCHNFRLCLGQDWLIILPPTLVVHLAQGSRGREPVPTATSVSRQATLGVITSVSIAQLVTLAHAGFPQATACATAIASASSRTGWSCRRWATQHRAAETGS